MAAAASSSRRRDRRDSSSSGDDAPARSTNNKKKQGKGKKDAPEEDGMDYAAELDALELPQPAKTCRHLFLQTLISRKTMSKEVAVDVYEECARLCKVEDPIQFETFIANLEPGLALCGLDIKVTRNQETGEALYVLVNTIQDEPAKKATEYTGHHIAFFRALVEKIMTAPKMSYSVNMQEAVRLAKTPITKNGAGLLIESFLAKGWLTLHPSGRLILSPRSLVELAPYLRETFDEEDEEEDDPKRRVVVNCSYCLNIVTSGYACPGQDCGIRLHKFCLPQQLQDGRCPSHLDPDNADPCKQIWPRDDHTKKYYGLPVGVSAIRNRNDSDDEGSDDDDAMDGVESSAVKGKGKSGKAAGAKKGKKAAAKGKGKKRAQDDDDEEDEENELAVEVTDEDEEMADSNAGTSPAMRKSSRNAPKKRVPPPSDDDDDDE
ncbi:hypothetical protein JCM6882_002466 [Rhodosporidiobolus microsporus]